MDDVSYFNESGGAELQLEEVGYGCMSQERADSRAAKLQKAACATRNTKTYKWESAKTDIWGSRFDNCACISRAFFN